MRWCRLIWPLLGMCLGLRPAPAVSTQPSSAARLATIEKHVGEARIAFRQALGRLPDPTRSTAESDRLLKAWNDAEARGFAGALEIARRDPKSDVGLAAMEWLLTDPDSYLYDRPEGASAIKLLVEHHAGDPTIGKAVAVLAHYPPNAPQQSAHAPAATLFKTVLATNPDRTVRGQAALGIAAMAKFQWEVACSRHLPQEPQLKADAEEDFERVARDYADCPNLYERYGQPIGGTLGSTAAAELRDIRDLRPGKLAPDIAGQDLRGQAFKLSDHRGKVVLLIFWASWCGSCMDAVPHEREIVKRYGGKPFVLIGVNGDPTRDAGLRCVAARKINWRSFWDGPPVRGGPAGTDGPISGAWNVRSWPTTYLIDGNGIIRQKDVQGKELDEALAKLLSEAKVSTTAPRSAPTSH